MFIFKENFQKFSFSIFSLLAVSRRDRKIGVNKEANTHDFFNSFL